MMSQTARGWVRARDAPAGTVPLPWDRRIIRSSLERKSKVTHLKYLTYLTVDGVVGEENGPPLRAHCGDMTFEPGQNKASRRMS